MKDEMNNIHGSILVSNVEIYVLYDFLVTVKVAPHECAIRTGQP